MFTILHISRQKKDFCVKNNFCVKKRTKKGPFQKDHFKRPMEMGSKGPLQKNFCVKKDFCVKKGPKKDYFSSLVLKRTKSLIKDLFASTDYSHLISSLLGFATRTKRFWRSKKLYNFPELGGGGWEVMSERNKISPVRCSLSSSFTRGLGRHPSSSLYSE